MPTPHREAAPGLSPSSDPYSGWQDPEKERKKGLLGNKAQSILAVVILAAVAVVGVVSYSPHPLAGQDGSNSAPQQQSADASNPGKAQGSFTVSVNGQPYGTFSAAQSSLILNHFMVPGDQVTLACVSAPDGGTVVARVGTNIRVYESRPLHAGDQQTWGVRKIKKGEDPGNAASADAINWFAGQADQGNPVAQYGLANMYVVGIDGLQIDHAKAIDLFGRAAAQNYQNAHVRMVDLQAYDKAGH